MNYSQVREEFDDKKIDEIITNASNDILHVNYLNTYEEAINRIDSGYHNSYAYKCDKLLVATCVQEAIYKVCLAKFNYECNPEDDRSYNELNLSKESDLEIYIKFKEFIQQYNIPNDYNYPNKTNKILKLFRACSNYHCKEIFLNATETALKIEVNLSDAPIGELLKFIRFYLNSKHIKDNFDLNLYYFIYINWNSKYVNFESLDMGERIICDPTTDNLTFLKMKEKYEATYFSLDDEKYTIKIKNKTIYDKFKIDALAKTKEDWVFEGDVKYILRRTEFGKDYIHIVNLDDFDINTVLKRIFDDN